MPEEIAPNMKELIEKEVQEPSSSTTVTKEEPHAWSRD